MLQSPVRALLFGALLTVFTIIAAPPTTAQSNDALDRILSERELTYGSAAWLVLRAANVIDDTASAAEATVRLNQLNRGIAGRAADEAVSLGEYAHLLMQTFDLEPGILYRLKPGPRYATRRLVAARIVQGNAYSSMSLSGERSLRILARALAFRDGERL